ncbi:LAME_0B00430g1_1 [Lachancea meyersii CBS 8951]|uniref:LAME_0B00430g1_1 n=1 Tax=Lachancea meyersii CBS 8951 TaxID=1266667 RepID=A0A1G4ISL0_9SACH|nr:LAME_0B00430g1_1 [Lachancea meyersii CBS 8951]
MNSTRSTRKRSTTGCLTCRRRRKKCDERKPVCGGCERNFLPCVWPENNEKRRRSRKTEAGPEVSQEPLDVLGSQVRDRSPPIATAPQEIQFHIVEAPRVPTAHSCPGKGPWRFENYSKNKQNALTKFDSRISQFVEIHENGEDQVSEIPCTQETSDTTQNDHDDPLELEQILNFEVLDPLQYINNKFWNSLRVEEELDMRMGETVAPMIDVPIDAIVIHPDIIEAQDPLNHQNYGLFASLLRRYKAQEIVTDEDLDSVNLEEFLFFACAKGFIPKLDTQYTHPSLTTYATFLPQAKKNMLIRSVSICCGATYLAWCDLHRYQQLSDELYIDCKAQIAAHLDRADNVADEDWLLAALQMMSIRDKNAFTGTVDGSAWHLSKAFLIIREKYYDINSALAPGTISPKLRDSIVLQPHERMFIESFVYQYSISILFVNDMSCLPDPYAVFKALSLVLKCPVYNLEGCDQWMGSPLLGLSLDAFEILAKMSYVARAPMPLPPGSKWMKQMIKLQNMCTYYQPPSPTSSMDENQRLNHRITSLVGLLIVRICDVFASKVISYETFDVLDACVQGRVKEILRLFKKLPPDHQIWGLLPWMVLIAGAFSHDIDDRQFIIERTQHIAKRAHSYCGLKMTSFLHSVWSTPDGLKLLFDRDKLAQVDL